MSEWVSAFKGLHDRVQRLEGRVDAHLDQLDDITNTLEAISSYIKSANITFKNHDTTIRKLMESIECITENQSEPTPKQESSSVVSSE